MIKVAFHKSLLPFTEGIKEITLERDTYYTTVRNILNLFPKLERVVKQHNFSKTDNLAVLVNGRLLTNEDVFLLATRDHVIHIVPIFFGNFGSETLIYFLISAVLTTTISLAQGYSFEDALMRGFISGVFAAAGQFAVGPLTEGMTGVALSIAKGVVIGTFSALGTAVANAITGPPPVKKAGIDSAGKDSDVFGSIVNTTSPGEMVALNYGMLRIGGQVISSDLETITDQRGVDSTTSDTTIEQETSSGDGGARAGFDPSADVGQLGLPGPSTIGGIDRTGGGIAEFGPGGTNPNGIDGGQASSDISNGLV